MKIEVRRKSPDLKQPRITIREKTIYICKQCHNHYYSYHFFCPQCLGPVDSSTKQTFALRITFCPAEGLDEIQSLLEKLSGAVEFDFDAALKTLPWICMKQSDPNILKVWKECLEASGVHSEIIASIPSSKGRKRKEQPPLFVQDAPYPQFLPAALTLEMRSLAKGLSSPALKLRWAETAGYAMNLLERIHKKKSERVLFVDFLFKIEEYLREFTSRFSTPTISEATFEKQKDQLAEALRQMETEMDAVREQIQKQL